MQILRKETVASTELIRVVKYHMTVRMLLMMELQVPNLAIH